MQSANSVLHNLGEITTQSKKESTFQLTKQNEEPPPPLEHVSQPENEDEEPRLTCREVSEMSQILFKVSYAYVHGVG